MKKIQYLQILLLTTLLLASGSLLAFPPEPFSADYDVKFLRGFRAEAKMVLEEAEESVFQLNTEGRLYIFGKRVTSVTVNGQFVWENEAIIPQDYEFVQTGIGKKSRSIVYDWGNQLAEIVIKDDEASLPLEAVMFDELSMYMELQQQAGAGVEDIHLNVIDEDEIKTYHYQRVGEEQMETDLGVFNTVKYLRIRGEDSKRKTEIWFASDWNYIVLRLDQKSSIGTFEINLLQALISDEAMVPLDIQ